LQINKVNNFQKRSINHVQHKVQDKVQLKSNLKFNKQKCFYYGKIGHLKKDCYKYKKDTDNENNKDEQAPLA